MNEITEQDAVGVASRLLYEYAATIDEARVEDFVQLFTPDAEFYLPGTVGHDAIHDLTHKMLLAFSATSHHISNVRVLAIEDGEIQATSHIYAWHRGTGGDDVEIWGQYRSRFRQHEGEWRFSRHTARAAGDRPVGAGGKMSMIPRRSLD